MPRVVRHYVPDTPHCTPGTLYISTSVRHGSIILDLCRLHAGTNATLLARLESMNKLSAISRATGRGPGR